LIAAEDGPFDVVARVRRAAGSGMFGRLLDCPLCLSVWLAIPFAVALGTTAGERVLLWLGLSGGSVFLERLTPPRTLAPPPASFVEGPVEESDVLLRE
jgi:hypothetical protein